jgi:hypothetical protein
MVIYKTFIAIVDFFIKLFNDLYALPSGKRFSEQTVAHMFEFRTYNISDQPKNIFIVKKFIKNPFK